MRRARSVAIGVAAALATWCAAGAPAAVAQRTAHPHSAPTTSGITWGACTEQDLIEAGAQCGMLSVPLNYSDPQGPKIQIAVSRIEHTSSAADYQGVILTNPGGPGGSGLDLNTALIPPLQQEGYSAAAADYDWIGFDPRGVGASQPSLTCDPNYFGPDRPSYIPWTRGLLSFWINKSDAYAQACAHAGAAQLALLQNDTTADSARDMDAIRAALGAPQITYYGFSYGTYLGQVYGTLFPSHVRRMILDSNVDPRGVWYQDNFAQDYAFNRNMKIWWAWLAQHNDVYGLGSNERAVQRTFYATERQLASAPAGGQVGPDEWTDVFVEAAYFEQTWLGLADLFADWVHTHSATAASNLVQAYQAVDGVGNDNGYAGYLAVQCTDNAWPSSWGKIVHDNWAVFVRAPFFTWDNAWFNGPCTNWPARPSTPVRINGDGVSSALLIDETLDSATPFPGSLEVRKLFPRSSLIAEPGGTSHADSLFGDLCVDGSIAAYLTTGALPPRRPDAPWDKTCAPLPKPVPTATSSTVGAAQGNAAAVQQSMQFARRAGRLGLAEVVAR